MKTFVYHDGALGDVLLSLPCLERLKAGSGWIHLACRRDVAGFLKEAGVVDAAAPSDQALFASLYSEIGPRLRTFLTGFDRAFVFTTDKNPAAAAAIRAVVPDTRAVRAIPPDGVRTHVAQYRLSQLEPCARLCGPCEALPVPPGKATAARALLRAAGYRPGAGLIAMHPGSGGRLKCWPLERYFELVERLQSVNDAFVVLFTGEAEHGELRKAVCRYTAGRRNVLHAADLDLMSAASLLFHCGLYIGNDSGFSHLAGMLGCTAIVLFGPTDPLCWRPLGPRVKVISAGSPGPMDRITVCDVIEKTSA